MCLELSHSKFSLLYSVQVPYFVKDNIPESQTVRLIETVQLQKMNMIPLPVYEAKLPF